MHERQRNTVLAVLFLGVLMGALDIAIVGPALPVIGAEFGLDSRGLSWVFTLYVLGNLIGTPLMAKLSDRFGRRNVYMLDVGLFAAGSLVVALSHGTGAFWLLLAGRAIQGLGAGGIFPVASAVIGDTFPPEKRGSALGLIGAVFGLIGRYDGIPYALDRARTIIAEGKARLAPFQDGEAKAALMAMSDFIAERTL